MAHDTKSKFEERKRGLEQELAKQNHLLRSYSRSVSETQVLIIELRGQIQLIIKIINSLKD